MSRLMTSEAIAHDVATNPTGCMARHPILVAEDDAPYCALTGHHMDDGRGMCRFQCGTVMPDRMVAA